jgi:hypothetical protein
MKWGRELPPVCLLDILSDHLFPSGQRSGKCNIQAVRKPSMALNEKPAGTPAGFLEE